MNMHIDSASGRGGQVRVSRVLLIDIRAMAENARGSCNAVQIISKGPSEPERERAAMLVVAGSAQSEIDLIIDIVEGFEMRQS